MKYKLSIISKNYWSSDFLKLQINEIFNNLFHITCHSPDTTPIIPIYDADMILLHEPSVLIEMQDHIKCDCPVLLMRRTITSKALQKLKQIPAGSTAIVVNLNDYMAKETLTNIYQLGIKDVSMSTWNPSQGELPKTDYIITPRVYDFLPTSSIPTIVLGSRILTADIIMDVLSYFNIDIHIADNIIKNHMIKAPSFFHGVNYLLENNRFMSIQWDILFNKINKGIAVVNKDNSISSMNNLFSQYIDSKEKLSLEDLSSLHKDLSIVLQSDKLTNELIHINNKKFVLNTNNMKNKSHYLGKIITIEPYNQIQSIQQSVHKKIVGNENVAKYHFDDIISKDKSMQKCITIGKRIANSSSPILIYGESGTGKELMASSIHNFSDRSSKPYVAVNCAGIPNELLESEFFGYQDGAFTGAKRGGSIGLFEKANGGTIFLDEISEIPYTLQARLLRVLQEKEIRKVGSNYNISIDVRIIAASNKNLYEMVEENLFRRDLYYRLNTFQLTLP
ncbi:MAG: sigma-54 factor interaction domain-containing protein, partial [Clostridium sp.]